MSHVADCAAQQDHHPNWYNVYSTVQIRLSSHDANGITERDFALVQSIDQYLANELHTDLPATPISST
jgi:4a-hydroxytetrahydrobiopterin dehydratase